MNVKQIDREEKPCINYPYYSTAAESGTIVIQTLKFPNGGFLRIQSTDAIILDAKGFLFPGERDKSDSPPDTIALHIQYDGGRFYYSMPFSTAGAMNSMPKTSDPGEEHRHLRDFLRERMPSCLLEPKWVTLHSTLACSPTSGTSCSTSNRLLPHSMNLLF